MHNEQDAQLHTLCTELERRIAEAERMETKTNVLLRNAILDVKEWYGRRWPLVLLRAIWETR